MVLSQIFNVFYGC